MSWQINSASPLSKFRGVCTSCNEFNPMLGHRGCRLGITFPEISEMQARAIFEAAAEVQASGIRATGDHDPAGWISARTQAQIDIVRAWLDGSGKEKEDEIRLSRRQR